MGHSCPYRIAIIPNVFLPLFWLTFVFLKYLTNSIDICFDGSNHFQVQILNNLDPGNFHTYFCKLLLASSALWVSPLVCERTHLGNHDCCLSSNNTLFHQEPDNTSNCLVYSEITPFLSVFMLTDMHCFFFLYTAVSVQMDCNSADILLRIPEKFVPTEKLHQIALRTIA